MSLQLPLSLFVAGALGVTTTLALSDSAAPATPPPSKTPATTPPAATPAPPKPKVVRAPGDLFYRDTTEYPPFKLTWNVSTNLNQVLGIFPHPILPQRALVATQAGLLFTDNAGRDWTPLPEATADKVGPIRAVAFHPISRDIFYVGSATKGIWMTTDLGKTMTQIGSKAKGLASDTVTDLIVYPGDSSHQTLFAVHGDAAPGISRSRDAGATWDVVDTDYHFHRLIGSEGHLQSVYLTGSALKEPDIQNLYTCSSVGEFVLEVVRDVIPTDMAFAPIPCSKNAFLYLATSDGGLYHVETPDRMSTANDPQRIGSKDDSWAGVNVTWGPSADALNLYLYDPAKLGLVISGDELATEQTASNGLLVSSLIKEGAMLRTNVNGTVFYATANGSLSIGRRPDDVPVVEINPATVELSPSANDDWKKLETAFQVFNNARSSTLAAAQVLCQSTGDLQALYHKNTMTLTARLPLQPAPPTSVTVDLSRFGGWPDFPLFDDGKHDDGAAGDGVYGGTFIFLPDIYRPRGGETRSVWPGRIALGVRATFADGHHQGAVGVVDLFNRINDITVWGTKANVVTSTEGDVTVEPGQNPREIHNGSAALRINAPKGPWSVHFKMPWPAWNTTSYEAVAFWIRMTDGRPPKELYLRFKDAPKFSDATTADPVPALNGIIPGADYQHVIVPLSQVIGSNTHLQTDRVSEVILSGDTDAPATLFVDGLQYLVQYDKPNVPAPVAPAPPSK